ncbi:hypothetical protein O3Q51_13090 [Cryomorphaceae bacterium 1068]|nr:hypothetical protein [Cryomorphaceae bacterium 1068]
MTLIEKRQLIIKEILDLTDETLLDDLVALLSKTKSQDLYSKELKDSIERGLKDYEEGRVRSNSVVMEEFKAKYGL